MINLYFQEHIRAKIRLVDGKIQIDADQNLKDVVMGYRRQFGSDEELYKALPVIFNGYWHAEPAEEVKKRG